MKEYFIELSKYGIMISMLLYTLGSIIALFIQKNNRIIIYIIQSLLIFLTQFMCFLNLSLVSENREYLILYTFIQVLLLFSLILIPMIYESIDKFLLNNMCMLIGIGLSIVSRLSFEKAVKQYIIILISLCVALLLPLLIQKVKLLEHLGWGYGLLGFGLLSIVLILGEVTHGSKITFTLFKNITFQPSEFVKILFILFIASVLREKHNFVRLILTAILAGAQVVVLVLSKDLGSALIFFVGFVFLVFAATGNFFYLFAGFLGGGGAAYVAYRLFDHVKVRVLAWRDPWAYIDSKGWAITQSLFAMGSGSWFGMGLLKGNPKSIPYVDQDFIFSSICEELGIVFGICLIILTMICFLQIMKISNNTKNPFLRLVAYGIGIVYIFQIFLTVGGGMNFIPLTGVTLPFISYGGSSCMTTMFMFFLVQSVYISDQTQNSPNKNLHKKYPIYTTGILFASLFVIMIAFQIHFVVNNEQDMVNNSYNSRQEILLSQNFRGSIYSRDGEILAETIVDSNQNETRSYPYNNLFSHVVGYSTNGRMGIEAQANYYLINTNIPINKKVANDIAGVKNPGDNVYSTLDVQIQEIAEEQLGLYNGAVIVTESSTGKILAMVSHPDFDPNKIEELWPKLLEDDSSSVLLNRVTQGLYPPGSTFKIVTALEYIRQHRDKIDTYQFDCHGYFKNGDTRINCYHGSNHGNVDYERSFAVSCNSSFANIGMSLDRTAFSKTLNQLLFDSELPTVFQTAKSSTGVSETMTDDDMLQASIGQGVTQMTPMHLNMLTSAIANNGVLMRPYVIDRIENAEGTIVKAFKPKEYGRLVSEEEAALLRDLMTAVVNNGTATKLKGREYSAAGKTGSAEFGNIKGESHAWFTGFAPADNPEVCVTIIIEEAGSGGDYAVPIARRIFDAYFEEK